MSSTATSYHSRFHQDFSRSDVLELEGDLQKCDSIIADVTSVKKYLDEAKKHQANLNYGSVFISYEKALKIDPLNKERNKEILLTMADISYGLEINYSSAMLYVLRSLEYDPENDAAIQLKTEISLKMNQKHNKTLKRPQFNESFCNLFNDFEVAHLRTQENGLKTNKSKLSTEKDEGNDESPRNILRDEPKQHSGLALHINNSNTVKRDNAKVKSLSNASSSSNIDLQLSSIRKEEAKLPAAEVVRSNIHPADNTAAKNAKNIKSQNKKRTRSSRSLKINREKIEPTENKIVVEKPKSFISKFSNFRKGWFKTK